MNYSKSNILKFGTFGAILGGVIAIVGYLILRPVTDSLVLFVGIRCIVGVVVAMIAGPLILGHIQLRTKINRN
jgi:hypothetical protein